MNYMIERLREPSTWRGIVMLLTSFGLVLNPEQQNAIIAAGTALAGVIGVFAPEKRNDQNITVNLTQTPTDRELPK